MGMVTNKSCLVFVLCAWGVLAPVPASAYCPTTTNDGVISDPFECNRDGEQIAWDQNCIPIGVHFESFEREGFTRGEVREAMQAAMSAWTDADCGDGEKPSLAFNDRGEMYCDRVEYVQPAGRSNNNIVVLRRQRDESWMSHKSALSTVTFKVQTLQILDVDIELFVTGRSNVDVDAGGAGIAAGDAVDLQSALLHEFGHLLGLAHSDDEESVMNDEGGTNRSRHQLSDDDEAGICALFPPGEDAACPVERERVDFTRECAEEVELRGCAAQLSSSAAGGSWFALLVPLALGFRKRWLRRH